MRKVFISLLVIFAIPYSQTTVNPDISVIGYLLIDQDGNLSTSGVELAIQGYVNPYSRADVFLHKHHEGEPIELEEGVISIERGLPFGLGIRVGKFRPDFGKINREHAHTLFFIEAPQSVKSLLGDEMWSTPGLELNCLLPTPWYSNLSLGYFQHSLDFGHNNITDIHTDDHEEDTQAAFSTRLSHFIDLRDVLHLEVGSGYYNDYSNDVRNRIGELDFKLKWTPDTYKSIIIQGEYFRSATKQMDNSSQSPESHDPVHVAYLFGNYQFNKIWNIGLIADYNSKISESEFHSFGAFIGFSPVEETTVLRCSISQNFTGNVSDLIITGQLVWALGPHKPHQF